MTDIVKRMKGPLATHADVMDGADEITRLRAERDELLAAVKAALNLVGGDGMPPDWDWFRVLIARIEGEKP